MCQVFLNAHVYAKQKINLTWPYQKGYLITMRCFSTACTYIKLLENVTGTIFRQSAFTTHRHGAT